MIAHDAPEYAAAGVDLATADAAKDRIGELVAGTRTVHSVGRVGAFGGMIRIPPGLRNPTLVLSTDGVGTKVLVALEAGRFDTVGEDLVNHSVNDILVHGAAPLAFMDYIAGSALGITQIGGIVEGIARGCRAHQMALAGGRPHRCRASTSPEPMIWRAPLWGWWKKTEPCTAMPSYPAMCSWPISPLVSTRTDIPWPGGSSSTG